MWEPYNSIIHLLSLVLYAFIIHFTSRNVLNTTLEYYYFCISCLSFKEIKRKKCSILHLPTNLPFLLFVTPFFWPKFPLGVISLSAEEFPLAFLLVQVCWPQIFLAFILFIFKCLALPPFLKNIFAGHRILSWYIFLSTL